jgi:hypothetical protein
VRLLFRCWRESRRAISINDPVAAAFGGIANYYEAGNQFPTS